MLHPKNYQLPGSYRPVNAPVPGTYGQDPRSDPSHVTCQLWESYGEDSGPLAGRFVRRPVASFHNMPDAIRYAREHNQTDPNPSLK